MTAQTPPTDRTLTAGEPLWMVHVLGPDEIYPAPDHATAVEWCAGMNGEIPESDVLCVAVPALWTGSSKGHAAGLKDALDAFSALSRPATSAASEGLGVLERAKLASIVHMLSGMEPSNTVQLYGREAAIILAALASPPVSERERELEAEVVRLREAGLAIYIYANDTLSGRVDGPDDRDWQRACVVEIRNRARIFRTAQPTGEAEVSGAPFWSAPDPNDTDIDREETVNGYRIVLFKSGGVRVTKGDYWSWSYPGDFEHEKTFAASLTKSTQQESV